MRNREVYLVQDEALGVAATRIFNLDFSFPIVCIDIEAYGVYYSDEPDNNPLLNRCFTKIEIVDGSDVLFSMDMREAQALQFYSKNGQPGMWINARAAGVNRTHVKISFGRDDSDNEWMLDPRKFVNPQLKITYALPISGDGKWTSGSQTMSVKATICEHPISDPVGFLMAKQIYEWASATTGDETIDMPRDYLYRLLMMRIYDFTGGFNTEFTNFKLSCDIDRYVPFNIDCRDLRLKEEEEYGQMFQHVSGEADGAAGFNLWCAFGNTRGCAPVSQVAATNAVVTGHGPRRIWISDGGGAACSDNEVVEGICFGTCLNDCLPYSFGNLRDKEEFFDPTSYMAVRLIASQGGTASLMAGIILQQVRGY